MHGVLLAVFGLVLLTSVSDQVHSLKVSAKQANKRRATRQQPTEDMMEGHELNDRVSHSYPCIRS